MKSRILTLLIAVVAVGLLGASYYIAKPDNTNQSADQQMAQKVEEKIVFSEEGKVVSYKGEAGQTALATLESLTTVTTEDSDFGRFVTDINDIKADGLTEYWAFYVNGQSASEGAGTYQAKSGDNIEWRLEKL